MTMPISKHMKYIESKWRAIPSFLSEVEAREFWDTRGFAAFLDRAKDEPQRDLAYFDEAVGQAAGRARRYFSRLLWQKCRCKMFSNLLGVTSVYSRTYSAKAVNGMSLSR
jgi:hypothetical protein